jgi:hypothetical protein
MHVNLFLDAGSGFLARGMLDFDISMFNGILFWRFPSADRS